MENLLLRSMWHISLLLGKVCVEFSICYKIEIFALTVFATTVLHALCPSVLSSSLVLIF